MYVSREGSYTMTVAMMVSCDGPGEEEVVTPGGRLRRSFVMATMMMVSW